MLRRHTHVDYMHIYIYMENEKNIYIVYMKDLYIYIWHIQIYKLYIHTYIHLNFSLSQDPNRSKLWIIYSSACREVAEWLLWLWGQMKRTGENSWWLSILPGVYIWDPSSNMVHHGKSVDWGEFKMTGSLLMNTEDCCYLENSGIPG